MNGTVAGNSPPGRRILWTRLIVIALVIGVIAILGLSRLADPFTGDQALFLQGARAMARGAVLYREFWDIKPPGIFLFYYVAGRLFGFSEMGVHSFELLWMILFAAILMSAVSKSFGNRIACLTALFTICPYYLLGSFWDLTQPEAIVALPMFVVLAALQNTCATNRHRPLWLLLAGCASGIVFLFKPVLFLVPLSVCIFSLDAERKSGGRLWHRCTFLLIGALLPFLVTTAFFVAKGGALCFLDTLLVIPLQLARSTNARSRLWLLRVFSEWFIKDHAFLLLFAAVAVLLILFRYSLSSQQRLMSYGAMSWGLAALLAILVQTISWWHYHFLLLLFPVALLAAIGLTALICRAGVKDRTAIGSTVILTAASLLSIPFVNGTIVFCRNSPQWIAALRSSSARLAYQQNINGAYRDFRSEVGFLSTTEAEKGSIYIFGDPVYYLFTNRANAAAVHSHTPDFLTPALQQRLVDDLARNHPAYIFVADGQRSNVTSFKPYSRLLKDNYLVERESRWGVWYHRRIALN